jgi:hypothetical protein
MSPVRGPNGATAKGSIDAHLRQAAAQEGVDPSELIKGAFPDAVREPPAELDWLWGLFVEVSNGRGYDGMGGSHGLSWQDLEAWSRLMGVELRPWEVEVMMQLEASFRLALHDRSGATGAPGSKPGGNESEEGA